MWASYVILERRDNVGGTWDLNRFPGIRSDSDMYNFGFSWKIWKSPKVRLVTLTYYSVYPSITVI